MALECGTGLEQWELAVATKIVGEFQRRTRRFAREDFEDLLHDCLTHWIEVRRYPLSSRNVRPVAYMAQVMRNVLTDSARTRMADKRGGSLDIVSLDELVSEGEDHESMSAQWLELLAPDAHVRTAEFDCDLARLDLPKVLMRLTPVQRRVCRYLSEDGLSITETAKRFRIPRTTLYEEIKRIRKVFVNHGLADYLKE